MMQYNLSCLKTVNTPITMRAIRICLLVACLSGMLVNADAQTKAPTLGPDTSKLLVPILAVSEPLPCFCRGEPCRVVLDFGIGHGKQITIMQAANPLMQLCKGPQWERTGGWGVPCMHRLFNCIVCMVDQAGHKPHHTHPDKSQARPITVRRPPTSCMSSRSSAKLSGRVSYTSQTRWM